MSQRLLLALVLIGPMAACGSETPQADPQTPEPASEVETAVNRVEDDLPTVDVVGHPVDFDPAPEGLEAKRIYEALIAVYEAEQAAWLAASEAIAERYQEAHAKRDWETMTALRDSLPVVDQNVHATRLLEAATEFLGTEDATPFLGRAFLQATDPDLSEQILDSLLGAHLNTPRWVEYSRRLERKVGALGRQRVIEIATTLIDDHPDPIVKAQAYYARSLIVSRTKPVAWLTDELRQLAAGDFARLQALAPQSTPACQLRSPQFTRDRLQTGNVVPEIAGQDLDGEEFRLSDTRGQVVVLEFWGDFSPGSRAALPHLRALVERLADRPFAVVGVNGDLDLKKLRPILALEQVNWRSFWNGPGGFYGPVVALWGITSWPTRYVIDHKGVIRFKDTPLEALDETVDQLLAEAEAQ